MRDAYKTRALRGMTYAVETCPCVITLVFTSA